MLILLKVIASVITGSIAIRADAVHSAIDLFGVIIGYFGIRNCLPDIEEVLGWTYRRKIT